MVKVGSQIPYMILKKPYLSSTRGLWSGTTIVPMGLINGGGCETKGIAGGWYPGGGWLMSWGITSPGVMTMGAKATGGGGGGGGGRLGFMTSLGFNSHSEANGRFCKS